MTNSYTTGTCPTIKQVKFDEYISRVTSYLITPFDEKLLKSTGL